MATKKHLVIDMDETLTHTFDGYDNYPAIEDELTEETRKTVYSMRFSDGTVMHTMRRPNLDAFMTSAFETFASVSVWSAGTSFYVHKTLDNIIPKWKPKLRIILTREDCNSIKLDYDNSLCRFKPLDIMFKKFPDMNEENTLILDDRHDVCGLNCMNNILIPRWIPNAITWSRDLKEDQTLLKLSRWFRTDVFRTTQNVQKLKRFSPFPI